jgi:hypothetical protein
MLTLLFIVVFGTLIISMFQLINSQFKPEEKKVGSFKKPRKTDLRGIYSDISIKPYGCFSSLDEKFFQKRINYTKDGLLDSGIIISDTNQDNDIRDLIDRVIELGFDQYGYHLIHTFGGDYSGMSIKEIAVLAKLLGYNFISVYKPTETTRGKIYLSYSPPMNKQVDFDASKQEYNNSIAKSDLPGHTLTPKLNNYTNEIDKTAGKELSCGYTCLRNGKPLVYDDNGTSRHYMCGSVGYPDIKTPTRFAVYQITER